MKTDDQTLIEALRILVNDIYCEDGIATACIAEGANRIVELKARIAKLEDALRFYADGYYGYTGGVRQTKDTNDLIDHGQRAREALKDE